MTDEALREVRALNNSAAPLEERYARAHALYWEHGGEDLKQICRRLLRQVVETRTAR
jgi:hypothetical protein